MKLEIRQERYREVFIFAYLYAAGARNLRNKAFFNFNFYFSFVAL